MLPSFYSTRIFMLMSITSFRLKFTEQPESLALQQYQWAPQSNFSSMVCIHQENLEATITLIFGLFLLIILILVQRLIF